MKTPEQYFNDSILSPDSDPSTEYTPEERLFLQKYLGMEAQEQADSREDAVSPEKVGVQDGADTQGRPLLAQAAGWPQERIIEDHSRVTGLQEPARTQRLEERLKQEEVLQFVSFTIFDQKYALPISEVQEVIRFVEPTRIPTAPAFIAGMINLRGRVTPLVLLEDLLSIRGSRRKEVKTRFIVVCRVGGLQVGLVIHSVSTMYRVGREEVEWNIEARLGVGGEVLTGLFKDQEKIIGIIAIDRLVEKILRGKPHVQAHTDRR
jgi:purine-binding chemotaxis protein CheW